MDEQPKIAICVPTRGLIFTKVENYIEQVRSSYSNIVVYRTENLPIPDCFNHLADQSLQDKDVKYIWFIEEDTVPPPLALDKFLVAMKESDIAAIDYGFNNGFNTIVKSEITGQILFTGFGCTFMKREVLESFEKPIFKADKAFNISNMMWYDIDPHKAYGMYDIRFGSEARKKGFKILQVDGECEHWQLIELGAKEKNNGCHQLALKGRIEKRLTLPLTDL